MAEFFLNLHDIEGFYLWFGDQLIVVDLNLIPTANVKYSLKCKFKNLWNEYMSIVDICEQNKQNAWNISQCYQCCWIQTPLLTFSSFEYLKYVTLFSFGIKHCCCHLMVIYFLFTCELFSSLFTRICLFYCFWVDIFWNVVCFNM